VTGSWEGQGRAGGGARVFAVRVPRDCRILETIPVFRDFSGKRVYPDLAQIVGLGTTDLEIGNT
jgi:hypothetical protein